MSARATALALLVVALGVGCGQPLVSLVEGPRAYVASDYERVFRTWTRSGHDYTLHDLDDKLIVDATFESWDFRWAYMVRYADDFRLAPAERGRLLEASLAAAGSEHEFYVALSTGNRRWGMLTRATSAWRVLLVDDQQHEVPPSAIDMVQRPGALERTYFPYSTVWRQAFRIRFPRHPRVNGEELDMLGPTTRFFILRFAGPLGSVDLRWDVQPG